MTFLQFIYCCVLCIARLTCLISDQTWVWNICVELCSLVTNTGLVVNHFTLFWWHLRFRSPRVSPRKHLKVPKRLRGSLESTFFIAPTPSTKEGPTLGRQQTQTEGFSSTIMERWQEEHGGPATEALGTWFVFSLLSWLSWYCCSWQVLVVHGFPNDISALRFEWAWQHPKSSRRLNSLPGKKSSEKRFDYELRLLACMLRMGPWDRWETSVSSVKFSLGLLGWLIP